MQHFTIEPQDVSSALEDISSAISLEAMSVTSVANRVADLVPSLMAAGSAFLDGIGNKKPTLGQLQFSSSVLAKALEGASYAKIGTLSHQVPPGFRGNLYEYTSDLIDNISYANEVTIKLTAFNIFLSKIISSPDARKDSRSMAQAYEDADRTRTELTSKTKAFFSSGSRINHLDYGDVIASNGQYLQFQQLVGKAIIDARKIDVGAVEKLVADAKVLLDTITNDSASGKLNNMSPETLNNLSKATNCVARDVEHYSLTLWAVSHLREAAQNGATAMIRSLRY